MPETPKKDEMAGRAKRVKWQDTKNEKGKYENEERYSGHMNMKNYKKSWNVSEKKPVSGKTDI